MAPDDPTPVQPPSLSPTQASTGDIYVRDHVLNEPETVSIDGSTSVTSISADGRYVVFRSNFNALAPGDQRGVPGLGAPNKPYMRDMSSTR